MQQNFLPIALNIANEKILVIGGGQSAWKKIQILQRFQANIEVVAREICDEIRNSGIPFREKDYESSDLKGYLMFYSCTNNPGLDQRIAQDGREAGVLVNIHDQPDWCQFVSPAIYEDGYLRIAVSSNARNVHVSIHVRDEIKDYFKQKIRNNEFTIKSSERGTIFSSRKINRWVKAFATRMVERLFTGTAFSVRFRSKEPGL